MKNDAIKRAKKDVKNLKKFFFRFRKFISKAIQDKKFDELDLQTCAFQLIPE